MAEKPKPDAEVASQRTQGQKPFFGLRHDPDENRQKEGYLRSHFKSIRKTAKEYERERKEEKRKRRHRGAGERILDGLSFAKEVVSEYRYAAGAAIAGLTALALGTPLGGSPWVTLPVSPWVQLMLGVAAIVAAVALVIQQIRSS